MAREQRKERRRLSHDDVRNNARESGGGLKYFNLPKGVGLWTPDKAGSFLLDFLPYEISIENHPDRRGDKVVPGDLWWKFPYAHHERIGPAQDSVVCPASFGKPCPICEEQARLKKNYDANKDAIRAINAKKQCAYIIRNPDDADAYAVFAYSMFKFGEILDAELTAVGDDALGFYDTTEEGKTVKVRFVDDSFDGRKFLKANRIDFEARKPMGFDDKRKDGTPFWNDDEIMEAIPCLDKIFIVNDYDALKKLFLQLPDPTSEKGAAAAAAKTSSAKAPAPKAPAPSKPPEKAPAVKFKKGDKVSFPDAKGKPLTGVVTDVEEDEVTIKSADGKLHEVDEDDVQSALEDEKAPAADGPVVFKKGDRVIDDDENIGTVLKVDDDEVTVKQDDGTKVVVDAEDLEFYNHDEKDAEEAGHTWKVGDKVTWDQGTEEGVITKLHPAEPKVKVKGEDGTQEWVAIEELMPF